jgi:hypothetical protein
MDDKGQKAIKVRSRVIPWTQWSLVRTEDVAKLLRSRDITTKMVARLLGQVMAQRKIMARWAMDRRGVDVGTETAAMSTS